MTNRTLNKEAASVFAPHKFYPQQMWNERGSVMKYVIALLTLSLSTFAFAGASQQDPTARLQAAATVINEIMAAPDQGIPEEVLNGAKCIAVVPSMGKGAFIVGGEHGRGVVTCRTAHGWSAPAFISIGGGNFGFQAGAQSVDLVMLFMNDRGVQGLLSSKFELTGEASATAGPVGRHASAGTDWKMDTEALSYSRTKGLFVGVALDGAKVQQDNDSTLAFYGKNISFRATLSGDVHAPARGDPFLAAVKAAEKQASRHETAQNK
jgi:lipid-binding SYLF domain-containing protein